MTTIIMLFMLPIGLYVYFNKEKKDNIAYQIVFDDFYNKTRNNQKLSHQEKLERFEQMLEQNDYDIIEADEEKVIGQKKILSMGLIMIGIGFYLIGLLFYLLYYFYIQKPHKVVFSLK